MENKKIYEYLIVAEWFSSLDKGTRLYYDYDRQGYVYHYETESTHKSDKYESKSFETTDYFISLLSAEKSIAKGELTVGPELGELEIPCKCVDCNCEKLTK
jgi:hypothetical protein